jgi:glycosyltransferase involved in cell wall biosynthesis
MAPLVSVILPCYNAGRFVAEALDSLVSQTHHELEILALDDGSTDDTAAILQALADKDSRVTLMRSTTNQGLVATLNQGVSAASGDFIARMDADDIAAPQRLEHQVAFLCARPEISLVGTGARLVTADGSRTLRPYTVRCTNPAGARFMSLFATPIAHPTMCAHAAVMHAHPYDQGLNSLHTEDYELFSRMLSSGASLTNLVEPLLTRRVNPRGVSLANEAAQITNFIGCARRHLRRETGLTPTGGVHRVLVNRIDESVMAGDLDQGVKLLTHLKLRALAINPEAASDISRIADMQMLDILLQAARRGSSAVRFEAVQLMARYRPLGSAAARSYLKTKLQPSARAR